MSQVFIDLCEFLHLIVAPEDTLVLQVFGFIPAIDDTINIEINEKEIKNRYI